MIVTKRVNTIAIIFFIAFVFIIIKLFILQVLDTSAFSTDYTQTKQLTPQRGTIVDRNNNPFSINKTAYSLFVEPHNISDFDKTIEFLHGQLDIDVASLEAKIDKEKRWVKLAGSLSKSTKDTIQTHDQYKGLQFIEESERYYPEASLAAHLLGFVGKNQESEPIGYFGVEGFYDKELTGLVGLLQSERDVTGNTILLGNQRKLDGSDGRDLTLTIDKSVQLIAKTQLVKGVQTYKAERGCVIVANPNTMEILALSCIPDFDPTTYYDFSEDLFTNWAVSSLYEPGSTFKPLVMAAALEEGSVKPTDTYQESGPVPFDGYTVRNWDDTYAGTITMTNILEKSSNVGMVHVGSKLGKKKLYEYLTNIYKLNTKTEIDLQGESAGVVKPLESWYKIDEATTAFGQGLSVNMIQMVRAFSSIINGGHLYKPFVVLGVSTNDETKYKSPVEQGKTIRETTSKTIRTMLASTVTHAEAPWDIPKGYSFGGKTGTAQIAVGGTYDPSQTIASYIGFTPVESPELIAMVVLVKPETSRWGSETAAPIFFNIARELLIYYNIPPK